MTRQPGPGPDKPLCGETGCKVAHPVRPFVDRPLARRIAARAPEPTAWRPAWIERAAAKELVR